jgi:hypothetical protein
LVDAAVELNASMVKLSLTKPQMFSAFGVVIHWWAVVNGRTVS